jgi:ATP-dependent RNA helicase RhlE
MKQVKRLKAGVDVLVATPGRLLDLMGQGFISLKDVGYFVLDEADRMLDMGFINDIKKLLEKLPKQRQSLFFSATMPNNILNLSNTILSNPKKVAVHQVSTTAETIQQCIYYTNKHDKKDLLFRILKDKNIKQILVFSRTKHGADRIVRNLKKNNIQAAAIHGDKAQNQRQKALQSFKNYEVRVLVATDIAARGIDIDKLSYVLNYDIPNEPETYVHRIGRCGRAGEKGVSISICEPEENAYARDIEKLIKQKITEVQNHPFPQTDKPMNAKEKKESEKEKNRKKQEFFANRNKKRNAGGGANNRNKRR